MDTETPEEDEDKENNEYTSSTSGDRGSKGGSNRGRGGGSRGGKNSNFNGKNLPKNQTPLGARKQTKDAEGFYNYLQSSDGKIALNHKGRSTHQGAVYPLGTKSERKLKTKCPTRPTNMAILGRAHRQLRPKVHSGQIITTSRML